MIFLLALWMGLIPGLSPPARATEPALVGHWFFYKKVYQGREIPESPGAALRMHFEFTAEGQSLLYWWHEGEGDHCRRRGRYTTEDGMLVEEVTWVDPENTAFCAQDEDMRPGRRTRTPFHFYGEDLAIRFHLADETLDLIWKRLDESD